MKNSLNKRNYFIPIASIIFLSVLLFVFFAEIFFRIWNKYHIVYDVEMWKYAKSLKKESSDTIIKYQHCPGTQKLMGTEITINSKGLRDFNYDYIKPSGVFRILVLGDSITLGWGVEFSKIYPKLLEKYLNENKSYKDSRYEVINTGAGNWNTQQEWYFFKQEGYKYNPDLVIVGFCINDAETAERYKKNNILFKHSYLLVNIWSRWNNLMIKLGKKEDYVKYYKNLYVGGAAKGWLICSQSLGELSKYCRDNGIKLLIVTIPELHRLDEKYNFKDIHALVVDTVKENNVYAYDLFPVFYNHEAKDLWVSCDDSHPNAKAHELIANGIYDYLIVNNLLYETRENK